MMDFGFERPVDRRAMTVQLAVLGALAAVYVALAAFWVPAHNRLLLPAGLLAMAAAAGVAWMLGPGRWGRNEPALVWLALTLLLLIPAVAGPPAPRERGFATGFLGVFCALGLWAVFRYPARQVPRARRSLAADLRWGLLWGAGGAAALSLVMLVVAVLALADGERLPVGWILASYWGGGLGAGAIAGLCRPMARWPLGSMLAGMPATGMVYGTVMLAMGRAGAGGAEPLTPGLMLATMFVFCVGMGPMAGLVFRD